jgi:uncharacterized protein
MTAAANKQLVETLFDAFAEGDGRPFNHALAEDVTWIVEGSAPWARAYRSKKAVIEELQKPLVANFASPYRLRAEQIIAEADRVVVQARGEVSTRNGEAYNNSYCFVLRLRDGEIVEIREYMDTALAERVLTLG